MLRTSQESIEKKYNLIEGIERKFKEGKMQLDGDDIQDFSGIKKSMKNSIFYGLVAGLAVSGICLANYSYLRTLPAYKMGLYLGVGPVCMPLLFRMRAEFQYQNYLLYVGQKY